MRSSKSIMTGVAVLATLALPMVAGAAGNKLKVTNDANTVDRMVVYDSGTTGRIGVNTSVPLGGLHLIGTDYPTNTIRVDGNETSQGGGYIGYIIRTGSLPLANDRLGFFLFGTQSGGTAYNAAGVNAYAESAWTTSSTPSFFSFATTKTGTTTRTERMRINSEGNIGVNTTIPKQKLEVNGGIRVYPVATNANTDTATAATKPTCDATTRGTIWLTIGASTDTLEVCAKVGGTYGFKAVTLAP